MKRPQPAEPPHLGDHMELGTPALDPAFVIGWHVGKAAADRELAARRVPEYLRAVA